MVTRRGKEKVEAAEAKEMEEGSREIVRTIGPDTLRSIETTETTVTAMTAEIARHKMKDTDVAEMHTEIGTSQKKIGGRPAGSPVLIAGKTGKKNASEIAVGTVTAAHGRIGVRDGPGRTTDPGRTMTGRIAGPVVAMMSPSAPRKSGDGAQSKGTRPIRTAQTAAPSPERPERTEEGETAAGPQPSSGDRIAQQIVKSPGRMPAPRPDEKAKRPPTIAQAVPDPMGALERNLWAATALQEKPVVPRRPRRRLPMARP